MKRERLKAQVKEGKELMKKLVNSKQRLEGFTKAPIVQEMELDDQDQILQVAHTKVDNSSHPNVPRKEGNKKSKQQGGKGGELPGQRLHHGLPELEDPPHDAPRGASEREDREEDVVAAQEADGSAQPAHACR